MSVLPLATPSPLHTSFDIPNARPSSVSNRVPVIFRRLFRFHQMDFELAAWQLTYLCLAPKRVYRNVYFHKQTKNTWARVLMIFRDYLLVGIVVATLLWLFSNRVLVSPPSHSTPADSTVEWAYAFDVHTNAFFPLYLTLYLTQLFFVPVILKSNWICLFVSNTLYLAAFSQYIYGLYLGLNALPFLVRSELLLAPLLPLFTGYVVSLLGFNVAKHVLPLYFGS
ncbi:UNC-50-like protein [Cristinia sonorae]|uniref:UNC-50-like protein n=1 Tax=Cristinia sonorae TaxID=1940300 RepID=A0A8K0XR34_9AGAR|nr:UNC-50-like protein [Cristinia sonorae]